MIFALCLHLSKAQPVPLPITPEEIVPIIAPAGSVPWPYIVQNNCSRPVKVAFDVVPYIQDGIYAANCTYTMYTAANGDTYRCGIGPQTLQSGEESLVALGASGYKTSFQADVQNCSSYEITNDKVVGKWDMEGTPCTGTVKDGCFSWSEVR